MQLIEKYFTKLSDKTVAKDLNTVREQGFYINNHSSEKYLNTPNKNVKVFLLEVSVINASELNPNGFVRQVLTDLEASLEYHRMFNGVSETPWSAWSAGSKLHNPHHPSTEPKV